MKCLKSSKTGEIIRISDEQADRATREWQFIPKSEWKAQFKKEAPKVKEEVAVVAEELTIAEKQLKKKKSK
jgi:hypothetical protein